jgi:hypothetical protein
MSFDRPVVVSGNAALTVGNTSILGQTVTSPTELTVQLSGNASGKTYSLLGGNDWAATTIGGGVAGSGGTF